MCGIVGVLGQLDAAPRILDALKRLEYRGYDSAGLTTLLNGRAIRRRAVGKLGALIREVASDPAPGTAGIGHTRWATHGAVTVGNAHPHVAGPVHVVHNGIIENFRALRAEAEARDARFETETDTEAVAQLVALEMAAGASPEDAVGAVLPRLEGAYALGFLFDGYPDLMIGARDGPPLAIGWGDDEMFLGSDAMALAPLTSRVTYLEDGDWCVLSRSGARIRGADGAPIDRQTRTVDVDKTLVSKGGHKHFMAKEIAEQPEVATLAAARYLAPQRDRVASPAEGLDWAAVDRVLLIGCGTASYAGRVAKHWFEGLAGIPTEVDIASEFRYRDPPLSGREALFVLSQSGETADTLAAMRFAAGRVGHLGAVVNVTESTIAREAEVVLPILAGPEIGVASTKAFTNKLIVLLATAAAAARARGRLEPEAEGRVAAALTGLPGLMRQALGAEEAVRALAYDLAQARDVLFLGRGPMWPIALEGALKMKEISYIHAEGYASGELKHGPIALVDETVPVVVFAPRDDVFEKTISNMQEVMARGGRVVLVSDRAGIEAAGDGVWRTLAMPDCAALIAPVVYALPAQQLAYHTALAKGTDVDQPRNLAKSVTVE